MTMTAAVYILKTKGALSVDMWEVEVKSEDQELSSL